MCRRAVGAGLVSLGERTADQLRDPVQRGEPGNLQQGAGDRHEQSAEEGQHHQAPACGAGSAARAQPQPEAQPVEREEQRRHQDQQRGLPPDLGLGPGTGGQSDGVDDGHRQRGDGERLGHLGADVARIGQRGEAQLAAPAQHLLGGGGGTDAGGGGDGAVERHRDHEVGAHVAVPGILGGIILAGAEDQVHEGRQRHDEEQPDQVAELAQHLVSVVGGVHGTAPARSSAVSWLSSWCSVRSRKVWSKEPRLTSSSRAPACSSSRATASESVQRT